MYASNLDSTGGRRASFDPLDAIDAGPMRALLLQLCKVDLATEIERA